MLASDLRFDGPDGGYGSAGVPGVEESVGREGAGKIRGLLLADIRNPKCPNACVMGTKTSSGTSDGVTRAYKSCGFRWESEKGFPSLRAVRLVVQSR